MEFNDRVLVYINSWPKVK